MATLILTITDLYTHTHTHKHTHTHTHTQSHIYLPPPPPTPQGTPPLADTPQTSVGGFGFECAVVALRIVVNPNGAWSSLYRMCSR
jgi:carbohydrate-binding DOMON domain-containing protein